MRVAATQANNNTAFCLWLNKKKMSGTRRFGCIEELKLLAAGLCDETSTLHSLARHKLYEPRVLGLVRDFLADSFSFGIRTSGAYHAVDVDQTTSNIYAVASFAWLNDFGQQQIQLELVMFDKTGKQRQRQLLHVLPRGRIPVLAIRLHQDNVFVQCDNDLALYDRNFVRRSFRLSGVTTFCPGPQENDLVAAFIATVGPDSELDAATHEVALFNCCQGKVRKITESPISVRYLCALPDVLAIGTVHQICFSNYDEKPRRRFFPRHGSHRIRACRGNDIILTGAFDVELSFDKAPDCKDMPKQTIWMADAEDACFHSATGRLVLISRDWPCTSIQCFERAFDDACLVDDDDDDDDADQQMPGLVL